VIGVGVQVPPFPVKNYENVFRNEKVLYYNFF
jgi:hypothetical protein